MLFSKLCVSLGLVFLIGGAEAKFIVYGDTLIVTEHILFNDTVEFNKLVNNNKFSKIVFKNCDGGSAPDGYKIAKTISKNNLNTEFSGFVASACALAFMGGKQRHSGKSYFSSNILLFHPALDPITSDSEGVKKLLELQGITKEAILSSTASVKNFDRTRFIRFINLKMLELYEQQTGYKKSILMKRVLLDEMKTRENLYFERTGSLSLKDRENAYLCPTDASTYEGYKDCPIQKNITMSNLGILTE